MGEAIVKTIAQKIVETKERAFCLEEKVAVDK